MFWSIIRIFGYHLKSMSAYSPLAERLRPKRLEEYVGQHHLVGPDGPIHKMMHSGKLSSFILWGPPGVGKTTLARMLANNQQRAFHALSAVNSGVKDVRETIEWAHKQHFFSQDAPIVFIDEIHRFNKAQQDSLLGAVENGTFILIGATTENPSFEIITPLLSRCQVYVLKSLNKNDLQQLLERAIAQDTELKTRTFDISEIEALFQFSGGDARKLLNIIDLIVKSYPPEETIHIDNATVGKIVQQNIATYDKNGEMHFDIISAFIKSIRGSDPNAAIYWLGRMLAGGEDPMFIARRLVISASEDIGLANPNALLLANACMDAIHKIGMPEGRIPLAQATVYLATSPKSNASYLAINEALRFVEQTGNLSVPLHLRNAPTQLMEELGYGKNYQYAHDFKDHFVQQDYLPEEAHGQQFYHPQNNPKENEIRTRLEQLWKPKQ